MKTAVPHSDADTRVPVTVLTGFLGSGKTTLLNRILSEDHGKRIAVIENEFGEIGIDHELVVQSDEEIFEMNNGCICCTVRGDLIRILGRLMRRKHKFDHIIIETTGMADPGPVAQTFFMDEEMKDKLRLDAIITVVDARHVVQHLGSDECHAQLAFADVVLLNKCDLVDEHELNALETQVRGINRLARLQRTVHAAIGIDQLLDIRAFDLESRAAEMPAFLQEELPFEWAGLYDLEPGRYDLDLRPGPDPTIDLVLGGPGLQDRALLAAWKRNSIVLYSSDPQFVTDATTLVAGDTLYRLPVDQVSGASAALTITGAGRYVLFTQHLPEEFELVLRRAEQVLQPVETYEYASPHEHDDSVGSVGIHLPGDLDPDRFEAWMVALLRRRGTDIFRTKGVLSLAGDTQRFVFQGVHMLFDGQAGRPWEAAATRASQLVFIGRDLDRTELTEGLRACLV
ncbi:MAG: GTP-binding protein [Chromatiaceae bacterium]|nr:GTP-binding protein [Chromatiaceae bacterium]